ncbi:bifunctional riboflavin kinase/FAD synthetase [Candidatus Palibaumannia cicadellinicola]|uniref:Riboflavin biosynthesis protein n=1 Tax=Baumannia cicadellinicola subsp. Homalodisca coagulata TaxID=374463 RepID=Q1LST0_BAUCH|nr:bifunctional riboflavin kinase/FAD synthetase [Candidatus Baumannia cicadellinicola]ABF14065.1 riboflavin biosynthesis protein RibF [Baumannia cicadellinicola str. Hc (Homalodisca coagulata)]MBS0032889.1 bifunctional riboflavin kinase/FAD synthetase [Candidatus Baumannia cicadellinicola]MCJ7462154.1 bifunctional riboflavin kinase/FAD synthetase [Candidatus Baumannia cicadellinicola]
MELIRGIHNLQQRHHGCVLTIGNFDGFHRGHQALINKLQTEGRRRRLPAIVIIFEPQPQEYFAGTKAQVRLTRFRDKVKYLATAGVDAILCITFNKYFSNLSAKTFLFDILVHKLGGRLICVGDDFCFGKCRQGNLTMLKHASNQVGFDIINIMTYNTEDGQRISSTAIRQALVQDRLDEAEMLLGHLYRISGRVIYGDALGRIIGFPTANISLKGRLAPLNGVYAVQVYGITKDPLPGIANIGTRPTVTNYSHNQQHMEVHLLDVTLNLYGYHLEVIILAKIRKEQRFASLEELKQQIVNDIANVRNYFKYAPMLLSANKEQLRMN